MTSLLVSLPIRFDRENGDGEGDADDMKQFFPEPSGQWNSFPKVKDEVSCEEQGSNIDDLNEILRETEAQRRVDNDSFVIAGKRQHPNRSTKASFDTQNTREDIQLQIDNLTRKMGALINDDTCPVAKRANVVQVSRRKKHHYILSAITEHRFDSAPVDNSDALCCWWCTEPFVGAIVHHPKRYVKARKLFEIHGCFCCFSCMLAYDDETSRSTSSRSMIYHYVSAASELSIVGAMKLKPAPSRFMLSKFGGTMEIDEFREKCCDSTIRFENAPNQFVPETVVEKCTLASLPVEPAKPFRVSRAKPLAGNNALLKMIK